MKFKDEYKPFLWIFGLFTIAYFLPVGKEQFNNALIESFVLVKWYAREHVILCLLPAFFIAGVISVFISQGAVIKYLGGAAKKWIAYGVSSIAGAVLAVCSCTILPLFASIYKRGAGLGPAMTFLYAGPAINVLSIILTMRVLGVEIGIARIIGAVVFSIVIGLFMQFIYREEEKKRSEINLNLPESGDTHILKTAFHFFVLVAILIFTNWGEPNQTDCACYTVWVNKGAISAFFSILFVLSLVFVIKLKPLHVLIGSVLTVAMAFLFPHNMLLPVITALVSLTVILYFSEEDQKTWLDSSWEFAKQIMPLLAVGVLIAGFLLGSPNGGNGIIPAQWISSLVGGNSLAANFFASIVGAFMYFATLTEIPILQGLMANGMGKGPALALLLAGPALSLPNMLVIRSVIGTQKTIVFVALVVIMATFSGMLYGIIF